MYNCLLDFYVGFAISVGCPEINKEKTKQTKTKLRELRSILK